MKISAYAAAAAAVLCLAVAGCSSDEEPGGSTPATESPSPTATATDAVPAPPELPAAATKKTPAGAEAFVKYYWAVVHFSEASGSVDLLSSISTANCEPCQAGINNIRTLFRDGGSIEGGQTSAVPGETVMQRQAGVLTASVRARLREKARVTHYGPGSTQAKQHTRSPASASDYVHLLFWIPEKGWMVGHLGPA